LPQRELLRIEKHCNLVIGQNLIVRSDQHRIAAPDRKRRGRLDRSRGIHRLVLERGDVVGERKINRLHVGIFQTGGMQERVQRRCIADPGRIHRKLHALEVLELLVAAALHMILAHENLSRAIAARGGRLVRHDLDPDAAGHGIVEPGGGGARSRLDLAGTERGHHVRGRAEVRHFYLDAFSLEEALLLRDIDRRVAGAAGRPYGDGLRCRDVWCQQHRAGEDRDDRHVAQGLH
jgi:hypothetical protein